jgi:penicillin V acylase-like amidase (Ntn superfamily)
VISARTMDFTKVLSTTVNFVPRGQSFPEITLPGEIRWTNKYGFIGMGTKLLNHPGYPAGYAEGLNEAGLSAANLWLSCSTYPTPKQDTLLLYNYNLVSFILGNFQNVLEARAALCKLTVVDVGQNDASFTLPIHFIISDAFGNHLIVEFMNGKMQTYLNNTGVLTNEPSFAWHVNNLHNYENLSFINNPKICWGDELYGSGQIGLPGDPTPVSRFIRASLLRESIFEPTDTQEGIGLALQTLRTLAVPCGTMLSSSKEFNSWTLWGVIRDHTRPSLYFFTDFNSKLYGIHLNKLNFKTAKQKQINIIRPDWYEDITETFESN